MSRVRRLRSVGAPTLAIAAVLALAACTPGASSSPASNKAPSGRVVTDAAKLGKVQLSVLDYFTGGTDATWMKDVVAAFHKKYPNITVNRTSMSWGDVMQALPLKLKSSNPPDIVPANNGWQSLGTLVQGHLVLNLDRYAKSYGWRSQVPTSIQREHEFSDDGKQMGTGSLFGMPVARSSMIEAYYNRALLHRIGATVPRTLGDFESDLAKAKAAGVTPISLGNLEQVGITGPLYSVMNALGQQDKISDLIYSQNGVKITDPATGFPAAVAAVKGWADKGYFTKQFSSVAGQDAAQDFVDGKALFRFDYSGSLPLKPGQSKGFGSFVLPNQHGGAPVATNSSATNFSVSEKSKHAAAAAAFLNFAASKQAAQMAVSTGTMPMLDPDVKAGNGDPLFSDDVSNAAEVSSKNASVPYLDWATPTLLTTMQTKMQDLLAGKTSTADVVKAAQADDATFQAKLAK
jgi:raffinose/stachyose/melibiose transport system substrate-binding protein